MISSDAPQQSGRFHLGIMTVQPSGLGDHQTNGNIDRHTRSHRGQSSAAPSEAHAAEPAHSNVHVQF